MSLLKRRTGEHATGQYVGADAKRLTFEELEAAAGEELGTSEWVTIDQRRVNLFADATGDHQ